MSYTVNWSIQKIYTLWHTIVHLVHMQNNGDESHYSANPWHSGRVYDTRLLAVSRATSVGSACVCSWLYIIEYTYMHVHVKYACGTDTQLLASQKQ